MPLAGAKLRAEKGVNFPDTELGLSALTEKDLADLRSVVGFADMIALSFLRTPQDVEALEDQLHLLGAGDLGIVLKIENAAAFRNLPHILLASLRSPPVGVMVARGDLAVEVGFKRLSEVQEEILWVCEAAHVPVIWATQVLEGLAKAGAPTRAEVSDAVMSVQVIPPLRVSFGWRALPCSGPVVHSQPRSGCGAAVHRSTETQRALLPRSAANDSSPSIRSGSNRYTWTAFPVRRQPLAGPAARAIPRRHIARALHMVSSHGGLPPIALIVIGIY